MGTAAGSRSRTTDPVTRPPRPSLEGPTASLAAQETGLSRRAEAVTQGRTTTSAAIRTTASTTSQVQAPGAQASGPDTQAPTAGARTAPTGTQALPAAQTPPMASMAPASMAPTSTAPTSTAPAAATDTFTTPTGTQTPATGTRTTPTPSPGLVVLVPAYQPDERLVGLVTDLHEHLPGCQVLVVDDGSGPRYAPVFAGARARGAVVVSYADNTGKGSALRAGLARAAVSWPSADVVCADADGQHTPSDIAAVAHRVRATGHMTLGVRRFTGTVPLRSRVGNATTALLFAGATGWRLGDTQTGLRGFPAGELDWLQSVPGDRYEYELSQLLEAHERGMVVEEVEIATVYEPGNTSSHFRPIQDSARIYAPLLRFIAASLASFVIDWVGVVVLTALTGNLLGSVVVARIVSGTANFFLNRRVFRAEAGTVARTARRYLALALTLLAASYLMLRLLTGIGLGVGPAKVVGDSTIYVVSYLAQRHLVFRRR